MKQKGFTLVEIIIGILILGIVVLGGYNFFSLGTEFIEEAARKDLAIQLASGKMEWLKSLEEISETADYSQSYEIGNVEYDLELTVNIDTYTVVHLTATWKRKDQANSESENLQLSTIFSR